MVSTGIKEAHKRGDFLEKHSGHSEKIKLAWERGAYDERPNPDAECRHLMSVEVKRRWDTGLYDTEEYRSKLSRATRRGWVDGFMTIFSVRKRGGSFLKI